MIKSKLISRKSEIKIANEIRSYIFMEELLERWKWGILRGFFFLGRINDNNGFQRKTNQPISFIKETKITIYPEIKIIRYLGYLRRINRERTANLILSGNIYKRNGGNLSGIDVRNRRRETTKLIIICPRTVLQCTKKYQ